MTFLLALRHWKLVSMGVLALLLGVQSLRVAQAQRHSAKVEAQLAKANALIEIQNEAVKQLKLDSDKLQADVERARKEGERGIAEAVSQAGKLRNTPANGCRTPEMVLRADL
jgi:hypothetical protein